MFDWGAALRPIIWSGVLPGTNSMAMGWVPSASAMS